MPPTMVVTSAGAGGDGDLAHGTLTPMNAVVGVGLGLIVAIGCAHESAERRSLAALHDKDVAFDDCEVEGEPPIPCTPETRDVAPDDGKIATERLRILSFVDGTERTLHVEAKLEGSALHVTAHPSALQASIVLLQFPKCLDASAWTGLRFELRGSFRGCSMKLGISDIRYDRTGAAWGYDRRTPPETKLVLTSVTRKARVVEVPFAEVQADLRSVHTAIAPPVLDSSRLSGMAWMMFDDMSGTCAADLYIDNVSFY